MSTKVGLAMAGGGPAGAIYEIGVVHALEQAIEGLSLNDINVYVGLSAGAFITANLANNIPTEQMCRAVVSRDREDHPFVPQTFLTPAVGEFVKSGLALPRHFLHAVEDFLRNHDDRSVLKSLTRLSGSIPVGVFDNRPIRRYLEKIYARPDRTDDFRELKKRLFVVAADLDSGEAMIFGKDRMDVPISQAVQASSALPGLYPPVLIDGRHYVDGVLLKTLHASTILDEGIDLAICINPIVPVDTKTAVEAGYMRRGKLIDRGMPLILSQTFRTLIHSRMLAGFDKYADRYKDVDILLIEPSKEDYRMFFTNIFSFASRKWVIEHAFHSTLANLAANREHVGQILEKRGFRLRTELLDPPYPDLWENLSIPMRRSNRHETTQKLDLALDKLERLLQQRHLSREETPEEAVTS